MHKICIATNFDDAASIVDELLAGIDKSSDIHLAVLMCAAQTPYSEVAEKLSQALPFPVIGGTTLAFPMTGDDGANVSATLALVSNSKMKLAYAVSGDLDEAKAAEQVEALYQKTAEGLGEKPRLIIPYIPMMPGVNTDCFVSAMFDLAGQIPVFGGVCTSDLMGGSAAVFFGGKAYAKSMVLLLIGGEVNPIFSVGNTITSMAEYAPEVTSVEGNIVKKVDSVTLCDYMRSLGIEPQDRVNGLDAMMQYGPMPVLVRHKGQPDDGVPEVRCISYTKLQDGSAAFSAKIPCGARINIGILRADDVAESAKVCLDRLMSGVEQGRKEGYDYSAVFCVSCVARYFVFVGMDNKEREILASVYPNGLAVSDYYGFCELGPTKDSTGRVINRSHSASIAMCAF